MLKFSIVGSFLLLASSAFAGVAVCPDNTYSVFPIPGVTGGSASSCGNANVGGTSVFAATPGGGSVSVDVLASFLKFDLNGRFTDDFMEAGEGSAVMLSGFSAPAGSTLAFTWASQFEERASGALFYILNGELNILDIRVPDSLCLFDEICATNAGSEVLIPLASGQNDLAFGAIVLSSKLVPLVALDPSISVNNFALITSQSDVPEPATLALTGVALAGLAAWRRRRRA